MIKPPFKNVDSSARLRERSDNVGSAPLSYRSAIITPEQLRAARGFMDWGRAELAAAARISPETIKNIEFGTFDPHPGTLTAILQAFAERDIQFLNLSIFTPYAIAGVFRVSNSVGRSQ